MGTDAKWGVDTEAREEEKPSLMKDYYSKQRGSVAFLVLGSSGVGTSFKCHMSWHNFYNINNQTPVDFATENKNWISMKIT